MDSLVNLLLQVMESPPRSHVAADDLEMQVRRQEDITGAADFLLALALFEPTDSPGPHLVGYAGLQSAARDALHDLGRHEHCLHDTPLMERP